MGMYPDAFDYYGSYGMAGAEAGLGAALGAMLVFYLILWLLMAAYYVVAYILHSLGLYSIAKRRGIHHPWLAWLPFGAGWILGSIGDQYLYVAKGKVRNRRKVLLGLELALAATTIAMCVCLGVMVVMELVNGDPTEMVMPALLMMLFMVATMVLTIIYTVFWYIAYYNLFASCHPDNAAVYLVLGIFFPVTLPFFVFACRKQDKGMPPRRTVEVQPELPVRQPPITEAPVVDTVPEEPQDE